MIRDFGLGKMATDKTYTLLHCFMMDVNVKIRMMYKVQNVQK